MRRGRGAYQQLLMGRASPEMVVEAVVQDVYECSLFFLLGFTRYRILSLSHLDWIEGAQVAQPALCLKFQSN